MSRKVNIILNKDDHGYYVYVPELPGCHSQADNLEDAITNIKEAIELYLETMTKDEISLALSTQIFTTSIEVNVA